jgi:hypothetical protein
MESCQIIGDVMQRVAIQGDGREISIRGVSHISTTYQSPISSANLPLRRVKRLAA